LAREEAVSAAKEKEKRCKALEADFLQLQEDLAASERARKVLQAERDELADELANGGSAKLVIKQSNRCCMQSNVVQCRQLFL
jgi:myosin heavy chain 9/10/11/14